MGLRVQLGHINSVCVAPQPGHKDFIVIHTNGLHNVAVDFCGCEKRTTSNHQQLIRSEWFPATVHHPQTCATFRLLELFHVVTLTGKLSAHEIYKSLEYLTDNTELDVPKVSSKFNWLLHDITPIFRYLDALQIAHENDLQIPTSQTIETPWTGKYRGWLGINEPRGSRNYLSRVPNP